jgi:hypothetical protein
MEPEPQRKKLLKKMSIFGILVSIYFLYYILSGPSTAATASGRIEYDIDTPAPDIFDITIYGVAVIAALFFSTYRQIVAIGAVNLVLCSVAAFLWFGAFISVWCFFSALMSGLIYLFLCNQRRVDARKACTL